MYNAAGSGQDVPLSRRRSGTLYSLSWVRNIVKLDNTRVLVDAYSIELACGTGLKTYSLGVVEALTRLGARPSLLASCGVSDEPALQEALLLDAPRLQVRLLERVGDLARSIRLFQTARPVGKPVWALQQSAHDVYGDVEAIYALQRCFRTAYMRFKLTGRPMRIRVPAFTDSKPRGAALWHATCPLPIIVRGARTVTTVHDLIPLRLPWATLDDKRLTFHLLRKTLELSDLVVADSECTKKDIVDVFRVKPESVEVVYPALPALEPEAPEEVQRARLAGLGLAPGGYMLCVGNIEPRKNIGRLLEVVSRLDAQIPLVLVGRKAWLWKDSLRLMPELCRRRKALHLGYLSRQDLHALYRHARFLVFPSLYEGFGFPALEAMALGCPVIAANTSSLPEVCGPAALYVDPQSVEDIVEKMGGLLKDEGMRLRLKEAGLERAMLFSPEQFRERLGRAYGKVL
jgi:glycosyltransferase involved in cell wall biosynthesis